MVFYELLFLLIKKRANRFFFNRILETRIDLITNLLLLLTHQQHLAGHFGKSLLVSWKYPCFKFRSKIYTFECNQYIKCIFYELMWSICVVLSFLQSVILITLPSVYDDSICHMIMHMWPLSKNISKMLIWNTFTN